MSIFIAVILGFVQGLCEFLPISSSGHLMITEALLGQTGDNLFFNILLHLASLLSVVIIFRKKLWNIFSHPKEKPFWLIVIATLVSCLMVILIKSVVSELFELTFLGFGFLFSATIILISTKINNPTTPKHSLKTINFSQAILIGAFQGIASLPGISRSASTTSTGLILGLNREDALDFSFILSVPIIIASMFYSILTKNTTSSISFLPCFIGSLTSFISSLLSIEFMIKLTKKKSWLPFSIYLFILSTIILVFTFIF